LDITIYTDGSALGNPGPGGYGAVLLSGPFRKEMSAGFRLTTNNRMELMAVCVALEALKFAGSDVVVYSDSKYVVDAVTKGWVFGWEKKGFAGKKNPDLWRRFLGVYRRHRVRFVWVKGHAETVENNRCDQMAVAAANGRWCWSIRATRRRGRRGERRRSREPSPDDLSSGDGFFEQNVRRRRKIVNLAETNFNICQRLCTGLSEFSDSPPHCSWRRPPVHACNLSS